MIQFHDYDSQDAWCYETIMLWFDSFDNMTRFRGLIYMYSCYDSSMLTYTDDSLKSYEVVLCNL